MPFDEELAGRVRALLAARPEVHEKKMFGGLCFLLGGNMAGGLVGDRLMVRVGPDAYRDALSEPHVLPMDFNGRPLTGMVYVTSEGVRSEAALRTWLERGLSFAASLPPKPAATPGPSSRKSAPRRATGDSTARRVGPKKGRGPR